MLVFNINIGNKNRIQFRIQQLLFSNDPLVKLGTEERSKQKIQKSYNSTFTVKSHWTEMNTEKSLYIFQCTETTFFLCTRHQIM